MQRDVKTMKVSGLSLALVVMCLDLFEYASEPYNMKICLSRFNNNNTITHRPLDRLELYSLQHGL
jgi:hypothetical protein